MTYYLKVAVLLLLVTIVIGQQYKCQNRGDICNQNRRCCSGMVCRNNSNGFSNNNRRTCQRNGGGGGGGGSNCQRYNDRCNNNGGMGMRCCNNLRCRRNYCQ